MTDIFNVLCSKCDIDRRSIAFTVSALTLTGEFCYTVSVIRGLIRFENRTRTGHDILVRIAIPRETDDGFSGDVMRACLVNRRDVL